MNKLIPIFILLALSPDLAFSSIKLEVLSTGSTYNYFALPPESGNRIDLSDTSKSGAFRVFYEKGYKDWSWTFLYAPLELEYNFTSTKNFNFNSTTFTTNTSTKVNYKFNSYRLGYRRIHRFNKSRFYYGGLLKIRDAEICVTQNNNSDCYDNIGPVPLLNIGLDFNGETFYLATNIDGLSSSKGSAYDINIEAGMKLEKMKVGFGARRLGGGADNETVTNFAAFQSYYISLSF
tara:strand:+ start:22426 stop:23127 length:702 start_codon:yes stop_codon:yes gene_type:complete